MNKTHYRKILKSDHLGCADLEDYQFDTMIDVALSLEPLWENAVGKNWKNTITRKKLKELYKKM